ncbi:hypothetical protein FGB62_17g14 [Gracilaria domingensis]|nr:hypothetical protein FGB62_17g14 [Gracilaria domingensis]
MRGFPLILSLALMTLMSSPALCLTVTCIASPVGDACFTENGLPLQCAVGVSDQERERFPTAVLIVNGDVQGEVRIESGILIWEDTPRTPSCGTFGKIHRKDLLYSGSKHTCRPQGLKEVQTGVLSLISNGFRLNPVC